MYKYYGDLVLREISYLERKIKWSYDVIADRNEIFEKGNVLPSRIVLRNLIDGRTVELLDENDDSLCVLSKV